LDFEILKAITETVAEIHNSSVGGRYETFIFILIVVYRFTKPISKAVQKLADAHAVNATNITDHSKLISNHSEKIENHERRIGVLETDVRELKPNKKGV